MEKAIETKTKKVPHCFDKLSTTQVRNKKSRDKR
jgi:hypothetical protein